MKYKFFCSLSAILCLSLAACGGGGGEPDAAAAPISTTITAAVPPATSTAEATLPPPGNLLVIGNSIAFHDSVPSTGWTNDWGMAAPSKEGDFAHLIAKGINANVTARNIVAAEFNPEQATPVIQQLAAMVTPSTVVVIELGENAAISNLPAFRIMYGQLIDGVKHGQKLICLSTWWITLETDSVMYEECVSRGGKWVFIGDILPDPSNPDRLLHPYPVEGVNLHPQGWGMQRIAERVLKVAN